MQQTTMASGMENGKIMLRLGLALLTVFWAAAGVAQNTKENADFKLAINLYNDRLYDLAQEQLKQFIAAYPAAPQGIEARFTLGLTQLQLKQYDEARLTFQTFALTYQDNPRAPEAWWNVGEAYAAMGNNKEAALAFERVKVFHPRSKIAADALLRAAAYFRRAGERDNARRLLRIILQEYSSSGAVVEARTQLAQIYFEEGSLDLARQELKRVIDGDPSAEARAQALLILSNIHQDMGRADQAQEGYQEIITRYKTSGALQGALVNQARLFEATGKHAEAIENLKKALAVPQGADSALSKEALVLMGDASLAANSPANAVASYRRYVESFPTDPRVPDVLLRLAAAASRTGELRRSDEASQRILKMSAPDDVRQQALLQLADNARKQGAPALAAQFYARYADSFPDDPATPAVLFENARVTEKEMRDYRKAGSLFDLLIVRFPNSRFADDAAFGAARCRDQLHEVDRALEMYRDFSRSYPASELRAAAEERATVIETFEAKNKDAGLEKLALLVGDVVADKDRPALARRLGEISFHDLKNYESAADQFSRAIAAGGNDRDMAEMFFLRARALEYVNWTKPDTRGAASEAYQAFLDRFPADSRSSEASYALFRLQAGTLAAARTAYANALARHPASEYRDRMLLQMGRLYRDADSTDDALSAFSQAERVNPGSETAEEATYSRCMLLQARGLADSAAAVGTSYLKLYPSHRHTASVLSVLGELAQSRGDAARAVGLFQELTTRFPCTENALKARRRLADALLASGEATQAVALYTELLHDPSASPSRAQQPPTSLLLALGKASAVSGDTRTAKSSLTALLVREPRGVQAAEALTTLGMIYKSEGTPDIATTYFRQAGAASPTTAANREVADILFDSGEYADAVRQYFFLATSANDQAAGRFYRMRAIVAALRNNELTRADKDIPAFLAAYKDTDPEAAQFELERGSVFFRQEDYPRALKSFQTVASKYDDTPSAPAAQYWIGKVYEVTNRPQEAIGQFGRLLKEFPSDPFAQKAHFALGNIYYRAEKWDEATKSYRQVTDNPQPDPALLPYAMSNLIETYETAGIFDAALTLTRKYLEQYPNGDDAFDKRIKIGILYQRLGYYDQSVLHLQALLDEAGSDLEGEIRYYIAEANYGKGDYQQAILDFLKVPYLVTKKGKIDWTATSLYMSGQAYEKMGRPDQALTMYRQILERSGIDPTFKAAARKEIDRVNAILNKTPK